MISAALTLAANSDLAPRDDGAAARVVEWLAVGGSTLVLFPLAWLLRAWLGLDSAELAVGLAMFYAAHLINDPHFAVTYLLFYAGFTQRVVDTSASRMRRAHYLLAGLVVPAALVSWSVFALVTRSAHALGWMIQGMFVLVGWHYTKQGFGVLSVLSARRGVRFSQGERRTILAHCLAAWAYGWATPARAAGEFEEKGVVYWSLAHPRALELGCAAAFALSALGLAWVLGRKWRREGHLPLSPLSAFLVTLWLWTVYTRVDPLMRYLLPALHSVQYLYFVWLLKRNQALANEGPPAFGPPVATRLGALALSAVVLAWLLLRGGPMLLDGALASAWGKGAAAKALGATPCVAAFFVVVNIHHYFMDSVIWRRENPDMQYLR